MFEQLASVVAGCLAGVLGLVPFLHVNGLISFFSGVFSDPVSASVFFASLAASHAVFSCFPAIFFGLPSASQGATVLPAHALASQGRGGVALQAMLYSFFASAAVSLVASPFIKLAIPTLFEFIAPLTGSAVLLLVLLFLASEKSFLKALAGGFVFLLSGAFGFVALSFPLVREPLLPLLTGLFGLPVLLLSFSALESIPPQKRESSGLDFGLVLFGTALGVASSLLPALSPAFLGAVAFLVLAEKDGLGFISLSSAVVASKTIFDVSSVFAIGKARSGAAAAVASKVGGFVDAAPLVLLAGVVSFFLAIAVLLLGFEKLVSFFRRVPGRFLSLGVLLLVCAGVLFTQGPLGFGLMVVAGLIGLLPPLLGLRHASCMGGLILPTLLYYFGFSHAIASLIYS